jgi:hypothetical protein
MNNPLLFTDPTGHRPDDGCRTGEGCNVTAQTIIDDNRRANDFRQTTERNKCKSGNKNSCSYAENHPVETVAFIGGGLLTTGITAASLSYMSAAEAAAAINAGINVTTDYIFTRLKGGTYTMKDAALTAGFSLVIGVLGGSATKWIAESIGLNTPRGFLINMGAQAGIQAVGNTLHRSAEGSSTTVMDLTMDVVAGANSTTIQHTIDDVDPYVLSHAAEVSSSIFGGIPLGSSPVLIP